MLIEILSGPLKGKRMTLAPGIYTLGRGVGPLPLQDLGLSHEHAKLHIFPHRLEIEDLKSTNGTFLNDQPVSRALLKQGDVVRLGPEASFTFLLQEEAMATQSQMAQDIKGADMVPFHKSPATTDLQLNKNSSPAGAKIKFINILIVLLILMASILIIKYLRP